MIEHYRPRPVSSADLVMMRTLDELHLDHPFMGSRMLRDQLARYGLHAGRRHIRTLMRRMGIEARDVPQPGTSQAAPGHKIYPYLLRKLAITLSHTDSSATRLVVRGGRRSMNSRREPEYRASSPQHRLGTWLARRSSHAGSLRGAPPHPAASTAAHAHRSTASSRSAIRGSWASWCRHTRNLRARR